MNQPVQQLHAIQAMLNAGQRNLRMERHTLLLWGIPAGVLFALCEHILTPAQLPDLNQRALAWLVLIGGYHAHDCHHRLAVDAGNQGGSR